MRKIFTFLTIVSTCISTAFAQNVGIGTPTPVAKLEVLSTDSSALMITNSQPANYTKKTRAYFRNGIYYTGAIGTEVTTETGGTPFAKLSFFTYGSNNASGLLERMTIGDNGFVGINNTDPQAILDVSGTFKLKTGTEALGRVLMSDALGNASWQSPSAFLLPFSGTFTGSSTPLFSVTASGTAGTSAALYGANASTVNGSIVSGASGILGEISPTGAGTFSAGVRGINRGNANGVGVIGYHAGTGYGVMGNAPTGSGVVGTSTSGIGGYFYSSSGTALNVSAPSTGTAMTVNGDVRFTGMNEGLGRVLTSDANGYASWQTPSTGNKVAFSAYLTTSTSVAGGPYFVTGYTKNFEDGGNNLNVSTGIYTVPVAGLYLFKARINFNSTSVAGNTAYLARIYINLNGGGTKIEQTQIVQPNMSGYGSTTEVSMIVKCNVGDQVHMEGSHNNSFNMTMGGGSSSGTTTFSGAILY